MIRYVEYHYENGGLCCGLWRCLSCEQAICGETVFPRSLYNMKPFRFCPFCGESAEFTGATMHNVEDLPKVIREWWPFPSVRA